MLAKDPPPGIEKLTTIKFARLPDTGWLGHGRIYKYDRDWNLVREFDVDHCPELTGFKGVTHSTIHPSGRFIAYTAETSKRIMRFDVVNERQMPDLVKYPGDNIRDGNWVIALRYLPDGKLLATRSKTMDLLDEDGPGHPRVQPGRHLRLGRSDALPRRSARAAGQYLDRHRRQVRPGARRVRRHHRHRLQGAAAQSGRHRGVSRLALPMRYQQRIPGPRAQIADRHLTAGAVNRPAAGDWRSRRRSLISTDSRCLRTSGQQAIRRGERNQRVSLRLRLPW